MNKKSYDEVQKKLEKNPFDQVIPMITKDIPSYKKLNSEEEKILIRLEELYKMKMQYMSIPEEKEKFKRKIAAWSLYNICDCFYFLSNNK